jgi:hypothetical protein
LCDHIGLCIQSRKLVFCDGEGLPIFTGAHQN